MSNNIVVSASGRTIMSPARLERAQRMAALYASGASIDGIAAAEGLSREAARRDVRYLRAAMRRCGRPALGAVTPGEVRALIAAGRSLASIAREHGISPQAVARRAAKGDPAPKGPSSNRIDHAAGWPVPTMTPEQWSPFARFEDMPAVILAREAARDCGSAPRRPDRDDVSFVGSSGAMCAL